MSVREKRDKTCITLNDEGGNESSEILECSKNGTGGFKDVHNIIAQKVDDTANSNMSATMNLNEIRRYLHLNQALAQVLIQQIMSPTNLR